MQVSFEEAVRISKNGAGITLESWDSGACALAGGTVFGASTWFQTLPDVWETQVSQFLAREFPTQNPCFQILGGPLVDYFFGDKPFELVALPD